MSKVVEMKGITKVFPGTVANDHVDFDLEKGEIHVLLGENGAGKTTLMNILYGLYQQTSGDIYINGQKQDIRGPNSAIALGIGMVHQHFMLVENFTVAENIVLGNEPKKGLSLDMDAAKASVREVSDRFGLEVDPEARIEDISVGLSQRVEILKALHRGAEILILDEPTAVLTPQEIDDLGEILKNLTQEGKSIILITHKLKEVLGMSDRVTILRRGKVIGTVKTSETTADELAEMMVGRQVNLTSDKTEKKPGNVILSVEHLTVRDHRNLAAVKDISFEVREGEILAMYIALPVMAHYRNTTFGNLFEAAFEKVDAIVCPTSPDLAFPVGERTSDPLRMYLADIFTIAANLAGICGISVPCGFVEEGGKQLPVLRFQVLRQQFLVGHGHTPLVDVYVLQHGNRNLAGLISKSGRRNFSAWVGL